LWGEKSKGKRAKFGRCGSTVDCANFPRKSSGEIFCEVESCKRNKNGCIKNYRAAWRDEKRCVLKEGGMMSVTQVLKRLIKLESDILYQKYASEDEPEFIYVEGKLPILISAPHGAAHTRNGKYKGEDEYTAAFAQLVAEEAGAHRMYACRKSRTDPNASKDAPYKEKVRKISNGNEIRFVIDLHGMWQHHEAGIELGTRNGKSCPDQKELIMHKTHHVAHLKRFKSHSLNG
jgi:hypothetical protein